MKNDFYTYAFLREDGTPYYIGKGKGGRAFKVQGRCAKVPPRGRILFLKKNLTEEEAFKHERYMIALFGRKDKGTGILLNFTDGGEGTSGRIMTAETIRKSVEHRKKITEITFPCGKREVFPSLRHASIAIGISNTTVFNWVEKGATVCWGKHKGFSARYLKQKT
jgi:hypothetical protein